MAAPPAPPPPPTGRSLAGYLAAVAITVVAILSQYFVPALVPAARPLYSTLLGDVAVVYGIPIVAGLLLIGTGPLRHWRQRTGLAAVEGLRWYGALTVLSLMVVVGLAAIYAVVDPGALALLDRTNPVLAEASGDPLFYIAFSFAVGAIEETIFRGWIFGFWSARSGRWVVPAAVTSVLFAGVHLYYGTTYGPAAPLVFPTLFFLGFAFAATFQATGGNLVVVALLHGAVDAAAFLTLIDLDAGAIARYVPVLIGAALFLVIAVERPGSPWRPLGSVGAWRLPAAPIPSEGLPPGASAPAAPPPAGRP